MGVYMSKPIKDKESSDFEGKLLKCGASSMQGWRVSQEDAHNCCLDFDEEISLFAVYDGHGGHEVAEYASTHLPNVIKENEAYKNGDYSTALVDAFLEFDATLKTPTVMEELEKIAKDGKKTKDCRFTVDDEDDEEEANVAKLREEASMPLAEVIAMYANGGFPKTPKNKLLGGTSKPMSPFLRAVKPSGSKDSEVSSSSSAPSSSLTNGQPAESATSSKPDKSEPKEPDQSESTVSTAQEQGGSSSGCSSSAPEVTSSSSNGEVVASSTTSKEEPSSTSVAASSTSPKRPRREGAARKKDLTASLLESTLSSDDESSNDETFQTNDDGASSSDDEEVQLNGTKDVEGEDDDEEEGDEEAEEESEEEDEDDEDEDEEIVDMKGGPEEPGMDSGCTAVVALVTKDSLYVANAGDSRAVLSRNGKAVDLSVDHKPEDPVELKRIQNAGGKVTNDGRVNGGLNLSRALGDHFYKRSAELDAREQMITALPDVLTETLDRTTDEFIVLACDGIWNSMSSQEVVDFVRPLVQKGETLSSICEKLFESCLAPDTMGDGTGCDNMTCVIVQLLSSGSESSNKRPTSETAEVTESQPQSKKPKLAEETAS